LIEMKNSSIVYTLISHSTALTQALQPRLQELIERHLLPFLLEVHALNARTHAFVEWLTAFNVPQLPGSHPLLTGERSHSATGSVLLRESWQLDPELASVSEIAASPWALLAQLRAQALQAEERLIDRQSDNVADRH
jgi:nitrogen fixation protein